jgi:AmmeMemoRadiSam system protein B
MYSVRPSAVAGTFYPHLKRVLERDVRLFLNEAKPSIHTDVPKAIIVPHAGYVYSGPTAPLLMFAWRGSRRFAVCIAGLCTGCR